MSLNFIFGGSGRGKTTFAQQMMLKEAQEEPDRRFFYLVPEQFTLATQRELLFLSPCHGILNIEVQSFLHLAFSVLAETGNNNRAVLDDRGKTMILKKVCNDLEPQLHFFGKNGKKKGVIEQIKSFLSEAMQYNVGADTLNEMIAASNSHSALAAKLADIKIIQEAFTDYFKKNYITAEEVMTVLAKVTSDSAMLKNSVIYLDGFTGFTPTQYLFLSECLKTAKRVTVCLTLDEKEPTLPVGQAHSLFYLSKKTVSRLREIARQNHVEEKKEIRVEKTVEQTRFSHAPGLAALEKNLFRYPVTPYPKKAEEIEIYRFAHPESEVNFVAEKINALRQNGRYRCRDIAVVTANFEEYAMIVKDVFLRADIPFFADQKLKLPGNAFAELIDSVLTVIVKDFERDAVMEAEKNVLLSRNDNEIFLLDNFLRATGIRGKKSWKDSWEIKNVFPGLSPEKTAKVTFALDEIRTDTLAEWETLAEEIGRGKKSVAAMVQALRDWFSREEYKQKLEQLAGQFEEEKEKDLASEYRQVYGIVEGVLDRMEELLGGEVMDLKEFREILGTGLNEARIGLIPPGVDQVMFGDLNRSRLTHIKVLFFVGLNDDNVPAKGGGGGILSDTERQFLADNNFELAPTAAENICTEQFYLYLSLTKPSDKLILTYGQDGNDGKMKNPAYIIDRVQKIFPQNPVIIGEDLGDDRALLGTDRGQKFLTKNLRQKELTDSKWRQVAAFYRADAEREKTWQKLVHAAFAREEKTALSTAAARALYGENITVSVSQFETYAACAFSYFLKYGLKLRERAECQMNLTDIGNLVHDALMYYTKGLIAQGKAWTDIPEAEQKKRAKECLLAAEKNRKNKAFTKTAREESLILRTEETLSLSIKAITRQMAKGKFVTKESEAGFVLPAGDNFVLNGRVDRVDTAQEGEKDYVKVIDYKTGQKEFSLSDFYYGLQMQLFVYLKEITERAREKTGHPVVPAGAFYFKIDSPVVERENLSTEKPEEKIFNEFRPDGLANKEKAALSLFDQNLIEQGMLKPKEKSDAVPVHVDKEGAFGKDSKVADTETFQLLLSYTQEKINEIAGQIAAGGIDINPYQEQKPAENKKKACTYCPYQSICRFDEKVPGSKYRHLKELSDVEVYQAIEKRLGGDNGNTEVDKNTTAGD